MPMRAMVLAGVALFPTYAHAEVRACNEAARLRSFSNRQSLSVEIDNRRQDAVKLVWLDYNGERRPYGSIAPGSKRVQSTYLLHAWMITDQGDACVKVFLASEGGLRVVVEDDVSQSE